MSRSIIFCIIKYNFYNFYFAYFCFFFVLTRFVIDYNIWLYKIYPFILLNYISKYEIYLIIAKIQEYYNLKYNNNRYTRKLCTYLNKNLFFFNTTIIYYYTSDNNYHSDLLYIFHLIHLFFFYINYFINNQLNF